MATMTGERERDTSGQFTEETTDGDILTTMRESEFPAVTAQWVVAPQAERKTVIRRPRYLSGMGLLQDVLCITGIKHNYGDVHGGMKRCRNCGNVEKTE
ncbi:hypothetical protein [Haladaptatus litoreus]|nr:hypothetical protein [Haladaptatus litoreus]